MLRRTFYKRARDDIAFCHRLLHIPYNEPNPDSKAIPEIVSIVSKKEAEGAQHWRKNWQDLRKNRLTASNFSHAIGFSPEVRRELWLEKIGVSKRFSGTRATFWEAENEVEALERYNELTGYDILIPGFVVYEEGNWLGASPDGLINVDKDGVTSSGVLEVKCPFHHDESQQAYPWKKVPTHCVPQLQGLMEIVDRDWLDLYCWTRSGSSLFRVWRDREFWEEMKPALVDFWEKHVVPGREIYNDVDVKDPHVKIREFMPKPCHEDCRKIMRGAERISDNCNRLFYEIGGNLID
uniref:YqaJ viral recombinase domain-containing protein n=1 Tax=Noccaea caerulescens TaxID=107243 RepID=A0A1J3JE38_NOCCA